MAYGYMVWVSARDADEFTNLVAGAPSVIEYELVEHSDDEDEEDY